MSYVLSVYSAEAYKEILMPAINDSDFELDLSKDLFGLSEDASLQMEVMGGAWRIVESADYTAVYTQNRHRCEDLILKDEDMISVTLFDRDQIFITVRETEASFSVYEKYSLENIERLTIGTSEDSHLRYDRKINDKNLITMHHAEIRKKDDEYILLDTSTNGTFLNEKRVSGSEQELHFGDLINIYGLKIIFLKDLIAVNAEIKGLKIMEDCIHPYVQPVNEEADEETKQPQKDGLFHRSPRNIPKIESEPIEIEAPPAAKENVTMPTFMAIGPSLTMALPMLLGTSLSITASMHSNGTFNAMMLTGIVTALGSSTIGTFWSIKNMRAQKKKNREDEMKRFEMYSEYLIRTANEIKAKYENNTEALNQMYHPAAECSLIDRSNIELWNRNSRHDDFLKHRLGLGQIPFQVAINVPKERFSMINDALNERPRMMKESYKMLYEVPVCVDLFRNKLIGLIGGDNYTGCYQIMHDLVAQIASSDCYTDVKLAFVFDSNGDEKSEEWAFAKWLPHVWSEDGKARYVATDKAGAGDVFYEITNVLRFRAEEKQNNFSKNETIYKPYYILFLQNPEMLEGELLAKYVYGSGENYGITTILMVHSYDELPNACEFIIENTDRYQGMYSVTDGEDERIPITYDMVAGNQLERMARTLAPIKVKEETSGGEIPNALTFFDMYGINYLEELNVLDRWRKNRTYESLKALVGQKSGGVDCYLDVHEKYHGPHGLVAGTTGSGKSETLQTYMLSLAINYSPDDIGFFIIDYKGGGMANLFNGLPHMIGQISNLSGNQVHRAMVSIKSENMRRQRIFNEHGVNNINLYTRLYKNNEATIPVPHMFIIIDEFAELKREEPDFMRELISVAQVGRSLGVHLILATQKPAGTVDDNIWSNSKFRLCLRVQDRQDSMDMLHKPDAAYITQAGRCYMQVGNDELYELFQSGWSGAVYDENGGGQADIARMLGDNGKAALVGSHAQLVRKERIRNEWISQLIEIADHAAEVIGCTIGEAAADKSLENNLVKEFFNEVTRREIEYPESESNMHRVRDFVEVYAACMKTPEFQEGKENLPALINTVAFAQRKKLPEAAEKTQLDAIVEYLAKLADANGYDHNLQLWLPVLPEKLYLDQLDGYKAKAFDGEQWHAPGKRFTLETMIGLYDDPENQAQNPVVVDLAESGNLAVVGMPMTGKSTFLLSMLYAMAECYSPEVFNIYALDFSSKMLGALAEFPHTGGIMFEEDEKTIEKFFTFLSRSLQERKKLMQGGNYHQYVQANGYRLPAMVVAIDNYASFRAKTENRYDSLMMSMMKEANAYGIYFMLSAGGFSAGEIPGKLSELIRSTFALELTERYAYSDVLHQLHLNVLPESNVRGRGLVRIGEAILEFQTALCLEAEDDFARSEQLKERAALYCRKWNGKHAKPIPTIPENPIWGDYMKLDEVIQMARGQEYLPLGYDQRTAAIYGLDLKKTYKFIVSGKSRTGKSNMMKILMASAAMSEIEITVIDFKSELKSMAETMKAEHIGTDELLTKFTKDLLPDFVARNKLKKQCVELGMTDQERYQKMQVFPKRVILILDLVDFVTHVQSHAAENMPAFLCNLFSNGALHNIYWFAALNQELMSSVSSTDVFREFTREKVGIHLGGNVQGQNLLAFDGLNYKEAAKKQPVGFGMLTSHDWDDTSVVVTPFYRLQQMGGVL